jgi:hypothetical protein
MLQECESVHPRPNARGLSPIESTIVIAELITGILVLRLAARLFRYAQAAELIPARNRSRRRRHCGGQRCDPFEKRDTGPAPGIGPVLAAPALQRQVCVHPTPVVAMAGEPQYSSDAETSRIKVRAEARAEAADVFD